jgi:hypothetical protein
MAELLLVEAAAALGVSVDTVRRRIKRGELQARIDGQGRLLVHLVDVPTATPSNGHTAAEHVHSSLPSTAEHAAQPVPGAAVQVAEQRLADAQHAAMLARLEAAQGELETVKSEISFLRDELRRRDEHHADELRRRAETHERERDQLHERLQQALAALAIQRALPGGEVVAAVATTVREAPRPWWRRWWPQSRRTETS